MTWTDLMPWNRGKKNKVPVHKREENPLVRRVSEDPFESLHQEFNKILDDFCHALGWPGTSGLIRRGVTGGLLPRTEVVEGDEDLILTAELPGVDEKDVEVTIDRSELVIRGEKRSERQVKEDGRSWSESSVGSFQRVLALPEDVDLDRVEATFKNGLLTVTAPWKPQTRPSSRQIAVRSSWGESPSSG